MATFAQNPPSPVASNTDFDSVLVQVSVRGWPKDVRPVSRSDLSSLLDNLQAVSSADLQLVRLS